MIYRLVFFLVTKFRLSSAVGEGAEFKFVDRLANLSFLKCLLLWLRKLHGRVY